MMTHRHRYFTNCNDGAQTGLSTRLHIDGYFALNVPGEGIGVVFLYDDGTYSISSVLLRNVSRIWEVYNKPDWEQVYFTNWGRYRLDGDTIKAQYFYMSEAWKQDMGEIWYLIKDDTTLFTLKEICYYCGEDSRRKTKVKMPNPEKIHHFTPFMPKPKPISNDFSLRRKRWYNCK